MVQSCSGSNASVFILASLPKDADLTKNNNKDNFLWKAEGTLCSPAIICVQWKDPGFEKLHHLTVQILQSCDIKVVQFLNDRQCKHFSSKLSM